MKYNISRELEPVYHSNFGVNGTKMKKVNNMNSNQSFTEWLKVKKKKKNRNHTFRIVNARKKKMHNSLAHDAYTKWRNYTDSYKIHVGALLESQF